ncbi:Uncharacterized conserved protein YbdZ, MbtH family [Lentzea fradiae]|uniref:Uncharacterized conserved protein YbdZ, MbtH family n=1 Tax=Lentzea fradiae TaxID=200378 RepID=A0A1G8BER9_9PSEU|nr:Uncharacterized conserved protein YbdZ, MbtH family [Lentzea fradiae]
MTGRTTDETYLVVRNDEEQYSIWPAHRDLPPGWHDEGFRGPEQDCLGHIDEVWTDMRPLSLRKALTEAADRPAAAEVVLPEGPDLVTRLCAGEHRVRVVLRPAASPERLAAAIGDGYVHVLFPDTGGGTELGVLLDHAATDLSAADLAAGTGTARLAGELTLDFHRLRCEISVEVADLTGVGSLRPV